MVPIFLIFELPQDKFCETVLEVVILKAVKTHHKSGVMSIVKTTWKVLWVISMSLCIFKWKQEFHQCIQCKKDRYFLFKQGNYLVTIKQFPWGMQIY